MIDIANSYKEKYGQDLFAQNPLLESYREQLLLLNGQRRESSAIIFRSSAHQSQEFEQQARTEQQTVISEPVPSLQVIVAKNIAQKMVDAKKGTPTVLFWYDPLSNTVDKFDLLKNTKLMFETIDSNRGAMSEIEKQLQFVGYYTTPSNPLTSLEAIGNLSQLQRIRL